MPTRRQFLLTTAGATAGLLALQGAAGADTEYKLPDNILYTELHPGRWAAKAKTHLPDIRIQKQDGVTQLFIAIHHPMSDEHYIVKHTVVDSAGEVVGEKTFTPKDKPESTFIAPSGYKGVLTVLSFCNLHDLWMATVVL